MLCRELQNYVSTARGLPFFYVVGDDDYENVLGELKQNGISVVHMSDFCLKGDRFPSVDELVDHFRTLDIDYRANKYVVVGLGEYLAFRGSAYASKELGRLKNTTLGNARVILLLRGVFSQATKMIDGDPRIKDQQRAFLSTSRNTNINITIIKTMEDLGHGVSMGFKELLRRMEEGVTGNLYATSVMSFENSLFPIRTLEGAYAVIHLLVKDFGLSEDLGTQEQWNRLLEDVKKHNGNLVAVYDKYGIDGDICDDLNQYISGLEYKNWLAFLYLKQNEEHLQNGYLQLVVHETNNYEDLKRDLLIRITKFSHTDPRFAELYAERKKLLKDFPEEDIAIFMRENEVDCDESIYRYTDNTLLEKKAIVKWVSKYGVTDVLANVYPALDAYLKKYIFECPVLADELTEYFDAYKLQKVTNHISEEFICLVEKYASDISYARLPTRDNAIKSITDKKNSYLYWIDALGVEYLSYIAALAKKKGLSIHVDIVRSDLPTITAMNKAFYDQWDGGKKYKEDRLDDIKHKDKGGYFFTKDEAPIYIPAELQVIEDAINKAAMELIMHHCKSFIIASDHGASRLAVIKKQESLYETETQGEHSGRCCKFFEGCDVPYKIEENGYIVLSDYGRFRGSRCANVEVHGGASLEEIVVPVITLTLRKSVGVKINVMNPDNILADRRNGTDITVYISDVDSPNDVHLLIDEKRYDAKLVDDTHFAFNLGDIKRAKVKPYVADVYDGNNFIGEIFFKVKGKTATIKDDFDNLF